MLNPVGVYQVRSFGAFVTFSAVTSAAQYSSLLVGLQIAKLCIIPCSCLVEAFWLQRRYTAPVIASVLTVLLGVAIV